MSAQVLDGRACARSLKAALIDDVAQLRDDGVGIGLATVMVGDEFSPVAYERRLNVLARELGVPYQSRRLAETTS